MNQLQQKGLRALTLLGKGKLTLDELADNLCVCRRYAQQVIKHLKDRGFAINFYKKGQTKYFWATPEVNFLPAILTASEKLALETALTAQDPFLQTAVFKMIELANIRLVIQSQK